VVRDDEGAVSFGLGIVERGERPAAPFGKGDSDWPLLANDRAEVFPGQRDYTGPFTLEGGDEALYLTLLLEGTAARVHVVVVEKAVGDMWLQRYEREPGLGPPPGAPGLVAAVEPPAAQAGGRAPLWRRMLRVPPGTYYIVFEHEHADSGGQDGAALLSYGVQLGEVP
jgi:hypothetical protein